jgi:hypothetical protein
MTKERSCMYGSIESSEFIDGVLEFCSIAVEHQVRTGGVGFYCPFINRGNVSKVDSVIFIGSTYFDMGLGLNIMFGFGIVRREFTKKKVLLRMSIMWPMSMRM